MDDINDGLNRRQYVAIGFICLLFPLSQRMPNAAVASAGSAAWLSCLIAIPLLCLVFWMFKALTRSRAPGRGLGDIIMDILGPVIGRLALLLYAAWFIYQCAFILRNGADRFASTIYPNTKPGIFMVTMLIACLIASMGRLKALGRASMLFRPVLLLALGFVFASLLLRARLTGVWQLTQKDFLPALRGSLDVANPLCIAVYLAFVCGHTQSPTRFQDIFPWLLCAVGIALLLTLCAIGIFGEELTVKLNNTFFVMIRDISLFNAEARIEALVITMWVFSDFVLCSLLLYITLKLLRIVLSISEPGDKVRMLDMSNGRWLLPLCGAASLALAFTMAKNSVELQPIARLYVPLFNVIFEIGLPLLCLVVGRIRKRV